MRLEKSTYRDYCKRTHAHLIPSFGNLTLAELTADHVRAWIAEQKLSHKALNNILIPLRSVFRDAFESGLIESNPLTRIRALPIRFREPDPFNSHEVAQILETLMKASVDVRDYFQVAFGAGLRTSELLALTYEDVDLDTGQLRINKAFVRGEVKCPKTSSGRRIVDISTVARVGLASSMAPKGPEDRLFVDPRTGQPWKDDQAIRKVFWYPTLAKLGFRRRNPYQTRHTFASALLMNGANPLYVASQMGHKDWGMIRHVYGRYIRE